MSGPKLKGKDRWKLLREDVHSIVEREGWKAGPKLPEAAPSSRSLVCPGEGAAAGHDGLLSGALGASTGAWPGGSRLAVLRCRSPKPRTCARKARESSVRFPLHARLWRGLLGLL